MFRKILVAAVLVGFSSSALAQSEAWSCRYDGTWSTADGSNGGAFDWEVVWSGSANSAWRITGDYVDDFGESVLDGQCGARSCTLTQIYQSGELAGQQYTWRGTYTDEAASNTRTINRFEGTWGSTPAARDGTWSAIAICTLI